MRSASSATKLGYTVAPICIWSRTWYAHTSARPNLCCPAHDLHKLPLSQRTPADELGPVPEHVLDLINDLRGQRNAWPTTRSAARVAQRVPLRV